MGLCSSKYDNGGVCSDGSRDPFALLDEDRGAALHKAIRERNLPAVEYLCENGTNVNAMDVVSDEPISNSQFGDNCVFKNGVTPLQIAAGNRHFSITGYLCRQGANVNAQDNVCLRETK